MIGIILPLPLRTLGGISELRSEDGRGRPSPHAEVTLAVEGPVTRRLVLAALEARYPMLKPTSRRPGEVWGSTPAIRDHDTQPRRAFPVAGPALLIN